ncbi:MAG: XisH family protein [Microcoleus anatoxicus]|uniref:XisH family protein n=1 Tax=Microcoleus anatoxicus TaxID=2705319 RepID=UPI00366E0EE2
MNTADILRKSCIIDSEARSPKRNMPAKDLYHDAVKQALIKEGWTITADPYTVEYEEFKVFVDLAADRSLAAERGSQKIAVEIKTFLRPSFVRELENALGQYILYRNLISVTDPERELYLAVSDRIYNNFFRQNATQFIVNQNQILIIVVKIQSEVISQWIK